MQHQWSRDNPFIPVRIEEEEGYIGNNDMRWKTQRTKGKTWFSEDTWRLDWQKSTRFRPTNKYKDTPRRRSERSERRGGTGAQPSEKSLSQTLHPGNSKQVHKTTTLPPQQQQTTTNPFAQVTTRGDNERHPKKWNQCQRALASCSEWDNLSTPAANDKHM